MSDIFYMSIGYPIGICEIKDSERVFNVELNGDFIGLSLNSYNLWKYCFFDIKSKDSILKEFGNDYYKTINELIDFKLLIELDFSDVDFVYSRIKMLTPVKNGFGVGLNEEGSKATILNQGSPFSLSVEQFIFWAECDNRKTILQIVEKTMADKNISEQQQKVNAINYILHLKTIDLIRMNRRERKEVKNV